MKKKSLYFLLNTYDDCTLILQKKKKSGLYWRYKISFSLMLLTDFILQQKYNTIFLSHILKYDFWSDRTIMKETKHNLTKLSWITNTLVLYQFQHQKTLKHWLIFLKYDTISEQKQLLGKKKTAQKKLQKQRYYAQNLLSSAARMTYKLDLKFVI